MNPQEAASNTRAPLEEQGSTMSPPHTWTESDGKTENEEDGDSRYLFSLVLSMPDGNILSSRIASDSVTQQVGRVSLFLGADLFFFVASPLAFPLFHTGPLRWNRERSLHFVCAAWWRRSSRRGPVG